MELNTIPLGGATLRAYVPDAEIGYGVLRDRPGILLAPGGAYLIHATREQEAVALEFLARGYAVFVLRYSLGFSSRAVRESGAQALDADARYPLPAVEMLEAIHYLKAHSRALHLDASRLFLMGFSAGAHVCASCGLLWNAPELTDRLSFRPREGELKAAGMVLCYPMLNPDPSPRLSINDPSHPDAKLVREFLHQTQTPTQAQKDAVNLVRRVTPEAVPAFVWHSVDDPVVSAMDTTRFVLALQEHGVPCALHLFHKGGHGLGLANRTYARTPEEFQPDLAVWPALADAWMNDQP